MWRWNCCLATVLLVVGLASCGKEQTVGGPAAPVEAAPECPKGAGLFPGDPNGPPPATGGVPANFRTAWVFRCRTEPRDVPGEGQWFLEVSERADTDAAELMAELRKPSSARTAEACTLELVVPPYFVIGEVSNTAIAPAIPTDECGKPRRIAMALLDKLPFKTISEKRLHQVQSQKSQDSGCTDAWKDLFTIHAKEARRTPAGPTFSTPVNQLRVCVYDRITDEATPVGNLSKTLQLDADATKTVLAALDKAGPAADCSAPHTRFAVLTAHDKIGGDAMVELDGCHRLIRSDNTLGQLDASTVALLGAP